MNTIGLCTISHGDLPLAPQGRLIAGYDQITHISLNADLSQQEPITHTSFCEMRAQYYVLQRYKGAFDYYGFQGYRKPLYLDPAHHIYKYDLVVPYPLQFKTSIGEQFCKFHTVSFWGWFTNYLDSNNLNYDFNWLYPANTYIMIKYLFDHYMQYWVDLANKLIEETTPPPDGYNSRVFAFLSERLLSILLHNNVFGNLRILNAPLYVYTNNTIVDIRHCVNE